MTGTPSGCSPVPVWGEGPEGEAPPPNPHHWPAQPIPSGFWLQGFWGHPQNWKPENSAGRKGNHVPGLCFPGWWLDVSEWKSPELCARETRVCGQPSLRVWLVANPRSSVQTPAPDFCRLVSDTLISILSEHFILQWCSFYLKWQHIKILKTKAKFPTVSLPKHTVIVLSPSWFLWIRRVE